ncbi:hypothetical protein LMB81_02635 [Limosilactobacillus reuteri]|nr:hypothetical protein [Limosilactobacillus reuteri]MCC4490421.1 hypothetical protein [Limosilactobacillus reuteri]
MKYMVTEATGHLGQHVVKQLSKLKYPRWRSQSRKSFPIQRCRIRNCGN